MCNVMTIRSVHIVVTGVLLFLCSCAAIEQALHGGMQQVHVAVALLLTVLARHPDVPSVPASGLLHLSHSHTTLLCAYMYVSMNIYIYIYIYRPA